MTKYDNETTMILAGGVTAVCFFLFALLFCYARAHAPSSTLSNKQKRGSIAWASESDLSRLVSAADRASDDPSFAQNNSSGSIYRTSGSRIAVPSEQREALEAYYKKDAGKTLPSDAL